MSKRQWFDDGPGERDPSHYTYEQPAEVRRKAAEIRRKIEDRPIEKMLKRELAEVWQ